MKKYILLLIAASASVPIHGRSNKDYDYTTPTPILKQINRHNEDGSYSYGYEGADGTYKIETKYPNGEVYGKYGYIDDQGKLREVEYGATRRGFEPAGSEISVPPPTLERNPDASRPLDPSEEDDGQYREDPSVYYKGDKYARDPPRYSQPVWSNPRTNSWYQQDYRTEPSRFDDFDNFIFNTPTTPRPYYPRSEYNPPPPPPQPAYNPPPPVYRPPPPAYNPPPPAYNPPPPVYNPPPPPPAYNQHYTPHYNNYNNYNSQYYPQNPYVPSIDYFTGSYTVNYR